MIATTDALGTVTLFGGLLLTLLALFVPITLALVLIQRWLGDDRLARLLGGDRLLTAVVKGTVLGAVTPFCGCSTIPLLLGLLRARVRFAGVAAFMLASPLLNPYILGVVALLFGARTTVVYAVVAAATSMGLGAVWELARLDRYLASHVRPDPATTIGAAAGPAAPAALSTGAVAVPAGLDTVSVARPAGLDTVAVARPTAPTAIEVAAPAGPTPSSCDAVSCGSDGEDSGSRQWAGWRVEVADARRAAVDLLRPMLVPMLIGVTIGAVLYGVVPDGWFAGLLGETRWWTLPLAALLGLPLYLRGEAAFPIGAGLVAAGVGEGPMLAMVIAGMGASLPEVTILSGIFRPRLLATFLGSVFAMAIIGGAAIPPLM